VQVDPGEALATRDDRVGDVEELAAQSNEPEPLRSQPASAAAPVAASAAAPATSSAAVPVAGAAQADDYVLPMDSLVAVAESAGLQWVNSDADKIRAVQQAMAAMPAPVHRPREIRTVEAVDEGPLVLVETKKDLSQIKLPFESQKRESSSAP
jgi:ribonuclease E